MRAKLKGLTSDTVTMGDWIPSQPDFGIDLSAHIGPADADGSERFSLTVCTLGWFLAERMKGSPVVSGTCTLFVASWDERAVRTFIERAVNRVEGSDWPDVARQLLRLGYWEFEDYRPGPENP